MHSVDRTYNFYSYTWWYMKYLLGFNVAPRRIKTHTHTKWQICLQFYTCLLWISRL